MIRLAIISTHPIQYNSPLFAKLAREAGLKVKVFFTLSQAAEEVKDEEFGKIVKWDIPLLEGFDYTFVPNKSKKPGTKHFFGVNNPTLCSQVEEWQANALLVYGWSFKSHLEAMRYFKGKIPILFRGDSTLLNETEGLRKIARRLMLSWVYHYVDIGLYVGSYNKRYFRVHGLSEKQLVYVPHVVDNSRFSKVNYRQEQQLVELKKTSGIGKAKMVFLFVGKFIEVKNTFLLLEAFNDCQFSDDVHLLFVGEGKLENPLKEGAKRVKNVHFLPFQNQAIMPVIYRLGNILVLPSKSETWGLAVNEAMASGLAAIVSSKVGCGPDLIEEGQNGYIFESENKSSLMEALKKAVKLSPEQIHLKNRSTLDVHNLVTASRQIKGVFNKKING